VESLGRRGCCSWSTTASSTSTAGAARPTARGSGWKPAGGERREAARSSPRFGPGARATQADAPSSAAPRSSSKGRSGHWWRPGHSGERGRGGLPDPRRESSVRKPAQRPSCQPRASGPPARWRAHGQGTPTAARSPRGGLPACRLARW